MKNMWYVILNPTSGNGKGLKNLDKLKYLFLKYNIPVKIVKSKFSKHEKVLTQDAIKKGFYKIISVGGDGTLHHIINGVMSQSKVKTSSIKIAVIPLGTGNDWVKTYNIPSNMELAIKIIKSEKFIHQDIGKINLIDSNDNFYFNNIAGVGFDAYVVNKVNSVKQLGTMAYLIGGITSFINFEQSNLSIDLDKIKEISKIFMINIGLCKYSGGGLRLTDHYNHKEGFFDVTVIKEIKLLKVLLNIKKLFNGNLRKLKEVNFSNNKVIIIKNKDTHIPYIQADGEIIGQGNSVFTVVNKAIKFIVG